MDRRSFLKSLALATPAGALLFWMRGRGEPPAEKIELIGRDHARYEHGVAEIGTTEEQLSSMPAHELAVLWNRGDAEIIVGGSCGPVVKIMPHKMASVSRWPGEPIFARTERGTADMEYFVSG